MSNELTKARDRAKDQECRAEGAEVSLSGAIEQHRIDEARLEVERDGLRRDRDKWKTECLTRREQMGFDDETQLDEGHHHCKLCRTTWYNDSGEFCPECGGEEVVELDKFRDLFERCVEILTN